MSNDEETKGGAKAKNQESFFVFGMIRVMDQASSLIRKHGHGVFERHAMLPLVQGRFACIPFKSQPAHMYIVCTMCGRCKSCAMGRPVGLTFKLTGGPRRRSRARSRVPARPVERRVRQHYGRPHSMLRTACWPSSSQMTTVTASDSLSSAIAAYAQPMSFERFAGHSSIVFITITVVGAKYSTIFRYVDSSKRAGHSRFAAEDSI